MDQYTLLRQLFPTTNASCVKENANILNVCKGNRWIFYNKRMNSGQKHVS